jgi:DnaJ-class molecular chaperone
MDCPYCNGTGTVSILTNPECHFDGLETPVYEDEGCEECGGTGEIPNEEFLDKQGED